MIKWPKYWHKKSLSTMAFRRRMANYRGRKSMTENPTRPTADMLSSHGASNDAQDTTRYYHPGTDTLNGTLSAEEVVGTVLEVADEQTVHATCQGGQSPDGLEECDEESSVTRDKNKKVTHRQSEILEESEEDVIEDIREDSGNQLEFDLISHDAPCTFETVHSLIMASERASPARGVDSDAKLDEEAKSTPAGNGSSVIKESGDGHPHDHSTVGCLSASYTELNEDEKLFLGSHLLSSGNMSPCKRTEPLEGAEQLKADDYLVDTAMEILSDIQSTATANEHVCLAEMAASTEQEDENRTNSASAHLAPYKNSFILSGHANASFSTHPKASLRSLQKSSESFCAFSSEPKPSLPVDRHITGQLQSFFNQSTESPEQRESPRKRRMLVPLLSDNSILFDESVVSDSANQRAPEPTRPDEEVPKRDDEPGIGPVRDILQHYSELSTDTLNREIISGCLDTVRGLLEKCKHFNSRISAGLAGYSDFLSGATANHLREFVIHSFIERDAIYRAFIDNCSSLRSQACDERALLTFRVDSASRSLGIIGSELSRVSKRVGAVNQQLYGRIMDYARQCASLQQDIEAKSGECSSLRNELTTRDVEMKVMEYTVSTLNSTVERFSSEHDLYRNSIADISGSVKSLSSSLRRVKDVQRLLWYEKQRTDQEYEEGVAASKSAIADALERVRYVHEELLQGTRRMDFSRKGFGETLQHYHSLYSERLRQLNTANEELRTRLEEERAAGLERGARADSLVDTNRELSQDLSIKSLYIRDMESQLEEAQQANRFYEAQLINSDNALKALKDEQTRNSKVSIDFATEMNKIRRAFTKENVLLKLKIEELELELLKTDNTNRKTENNNNTGTESANVDIAQQ